MVWQGGMSFHGGFAGVVIAALLFCLRQNASLLSTGDLLALATPPGLFLGRLANFTNNELGASNGRSLGGDLSRRSRAGLPRG